MKRFVAVVLALLAGPIVVAWLSRITSPTGSAHWMLAILAPTTPAEYWACVAGVATIGVVAVAWKGLKALGLTKRDMLTRAQRDARQCAIERCEEFARVIIPLSTDVVNELARGKVEVFVKPGTNVGFDPPTKERLDAAGKWFLSLTPDLRGQLVDLLNRLEGWAMYFTNELADSKIAFGPCAPYFCSLVIQSYAVLLLMRSNASSGNYPNVVKLFEAWLHELEEEKRGVLRGDLLKKLESLQSRGTPSAKLGPPLGTVID